LAIAPLHGRPAALKLVSRGPARQPRPEGVVRRKPPLGTRARRKRQEKFVKVIIWASATLLLVLIAAFIAASWLR